MNVDRIKKSWMDVIATGDDFPRLFYAVLFDLAPGVAELFPIDMAHQRRKLVAMLGNVVKAMEGNSIDPVLRELGKDHRRFGATADHYPVVGQALIATMAYLVPWDTEAAEAWESAYGHVAATMSSAATELERLGVPPWMSYVVQRQEGDLDVALVEVARDAGAAGYRWDSGSPYWIRPALPGAGWVEGEVHASDTDEEWAVFRVELSDDDFDALAVASTPVGSPLVVAPVYTLESEPHD